MTKAAESKEEPLEELTDGKLEEIEKPNIFLKHWKKKDTPYGNDYTTNFAQAPDSPRYPDEDKGYKSETYVSEKKKKAKIKEPVESKIQRVDDEEAAASYYGDVAQPKVGTKHNDPDTNAGKFFRKQPKEVIQHQEHTTYDPEMAEKWKAELNKISQVHLMNVDDESPPAEKGLTINGDASQASKSIRPVDKILPLLPMIASIASGGEEEEETTKAAPKDLESTQASNIPKKDSWIAGMGGKDIGLVSRIREPRGQSHGSQSTRERNAGTKLPFTELSDPRRELRDAKTHRRKKADNSNCPYCNNAGKNKEHDKNPDKFHAWMDSERQKSMLTDTRFMNKIESADPSTVQHEPKKRKPHLDTGKSPFKTPKSTIDEVRSRDTHNAMPKGQEKIPFKVLRGSKTGKPYLINAKDRDDIDPDLEKASSIGTPDKTDAPAKDFIAPSTNPKNLPSMYKDPSGKTPDTGNAPNLKPSRGKLGFLKDKNPFAGSKQKPQEEGNMITDAGNIGVKVGGTNPNAMRKVPHGVAAQDISNKSFYSLRTKDGYGSGDLSLQNVTPNTVVNDKETYIGQTVSGKHRMIDRNKITNTRIGDDIHYYVNGIEDRGVVVKMGNEYIQVFKEDGNFHDVHINDTFFVKDIVVNKTWDSMNEYERHESLTKIHAPSARFLIKSWNDLPTEIKELLTKKGVGSRIPASSGITPDNSTPKVEDENTQYHDIHGKLLGTGTKGKRAHQIYTDGWSSIPEEKEKSEDFRKLKPAYQGDAEEKEKSDVEQGTYGNVGNTSDIAPSTSTNLDVSESTGYEERPHISVEEVGSLPRRDAKDNGDDETKEKEDDIKEPKESKDTQKVGVPTANYNTFGITYAVKANTVWNKKTQRWEQKDG